MTGLAAHRIKKIRAEQGLLQKELAAQVGVEPITVSRWERGVADPSIPNVRKLAVISGHPVSYFLDVEQA